MRRALQPFAVAATTLGVACVTITPPTGSPAPRNTCSTDLDCARYTQGGVAATCSSGICATQAPVSEWTAVVTLSQDAAYAAGATFAVSYSQLLKSAATSPCADSCPTNEICAPLPALATPVSAQNGQDAFDVEVTLQGAETANWNLGNPGVTALPVIPVLRPVAPAGLPLESIQISETLNTGADAVRGPGGGPGLDFSISVPPGTYEQTLTPMPPFDQAFPPDVRIVDFTMPFAEQSVFFGCDPKSDPRCTPFDPISQGGSTPTHPIFDLSRADGKPLDGWVAFLQDETTLRPISNQVLLSGSDANNVQLLTSHHPASGNAFENAALVMQPPASSGLPTAIFKAFGFSLDAKQTYPELPIAVQVSGSAVAQSSGSPIAADIVFDATGLCRVPTQPPGQTAASFDQSGDLTFSQTISVDGTFDVTLPQGIYRVTVRPRDPTIAVTINPNFKTVDVDTSGTCLGPIKPGPLVAGPLQTVSGKAKVGDERPLAAAVIEAIPTACSGPTSEPACMPRSGQTTTANDGSYSLSLDPGVYSLRARPAEGSALPWVVNTLTVSSASMTPGPDIVVPAPVYAGLVLEDLKCNPIVEGLVRVYETPATGSAFEIGEALTDSTGHYDMYLEPPAQ